jgi:hypothetical protein
MFQNQGQGDPPVISQQPGIMNPQFMQNNPPGSGPPQYPMGQYSTPGYPQQPMQGGYPPQQGAYLPQGPYYNQQQQQSGDGGMMSKVMEIVNEVADVNPMNSMHSAGNILTGPRAPPIMPRNAPLNTILIFYSCLVPFLNVFYYSWSCGRVPSWIGASY